MCGIIGYIGARIAPPIVLEGLKRLEYRGYDSAGICICGDSGFFAIRETGKIEKLLEKAATYEMHGNVSIGHTRWATHGKPTVENAHPHSDCKKNIFVVHNGIIENYLALKKELIGEGHIFTSDTDTEVVPHLVEKFLSRCNGLEDAVKRALRLIRGTYAMLIISESEPEKIIAARMSSPLRIGIGANEFIIASDPTAIIHHTKELVTLMDGEIAVIDKNEYSVSMLDGQATAEKEIEKIDWDIQTAEKEGFDHFMLKEIFEEPNVVENSIRGRLLAEEGLSMLGGLESAKDDLRKISKIYLVGCGTAYHAAIIGKYMLEEYSGISVEASIASEFRYSKPVFNTKNDALMAISQSGETADTLAAVRESKTKGLLTLGMVNVVGSTIARETIAGVYNHAGPEISVASTKVFVSQLAVLSLLVLFFGRMRAMSVATGKSIVQELQALPLKIQKILDSSAAISKIAEKYSLYKNFFFLGRKYCYPIALEGSLKLKEISYIHSEGLPSGELKHGSLALVGADFPSVCICPRDSVYEKNFSNMLEIKSRGGKIIAITTEGNGDIGEVADDVIYIPKTVEMLEPILAVIPLQLFAYYTAKYLDLDIDKPRNLAKSVTVE